MVVRPKFRCGQSFDITLQVILLQTKYCAQFCRTVMLEVFDYLHKSECTIPFPGWKFIPDGNGIVDYQESNITSRKMQQNHHD